MVDAFTITIPSGRDRTIRVHLPPRYGSDGRRHPVLYMHDGQNLFSDESAWRRRFPSMVAILYAPEPEEA